MSTTWKPSKPVVRDWPWLERELDSLKNGLEDPAPFLSLHLRNVEPARITPGMIVNADGVNWNPGSGPGTYQRNEDNTAWVSLRGWPLPGDYSTNAEYVSAVQTLATGQHFTQNGGLIHRFADRVFVGGAIDNDGAFPNVDTDWLSAHQNGLPIKRMIGAVNTGNTTSGSPVVTFTSNSVLPSVGAQFFADSAIPDGTTVVSLDSATQITLSNNATANTTTNTFFSNNTLTTVGSGVSAGTFGITNDAANSAIGALWASQSLNFTSSGTACIGLMAVAVNNNATLGNKAWGFYVEGHRTSNVVGQTIGEEISIFSTSGSETKATSFQQSTTHALQISAGCGLGGELPSGTQVDLGAVMYVAASPRAFKAGIVFGSNSITGTDGITVTTAAPVLSMAPGHSLDWHNSAEAVVGRIMTTNTDSAAKTELRFSSAGTQILGDAGQALFLVNHITSAVNYISTSAAVTTASPALSAVGTDTNIDLRLIPKGTGAVVTNSEPLTIARSTAIPAGGTAGLGLRVSSTTNFGIFFGSGAPTLSAAKGSLYLRSDGSSTTTRLYVNTDGGTTWTNFTSAA